MRQRCFAGALMLTLVAGATLLPSISVDARQPRSGADASVPSGEMALGSVTISRSVMADGKPLKAGTYRLRLTGDNASPAAAGQTPQLERWVEFLQGSKVVGREVVSIVPKEEIGIVAQDTPPRDGGAKVQLLKGNDYLRIWVNRGGTETGS
jgi:hypothetical protein